ncbi:MAG: ATPase, T2SS/T4P/T4SS family [Pseudomonadota bacterium]|nr:ATPase, T2SS/T4P/T4SS family [Pseudomonadota bacterium]
MVSPSFPRRPGVLGGKKKDGKSSETEAQDVGKTSGAALKERLAARAAIRAKMDTSAPTGDINVDELLKDTGDTMTGPGGMLERPPEQREIMVLFENGLLLVSRSHMLDPYVLKLESYARLRNIKVERKIPVTLEIIRESYRRAGGGGVAGSATSPTKMQRDILQLIQEAASENASDIHIVADPASCIVEMRQNGVLRQKLEWRPEYGLDFCAACFAMADASDANYNPNEYQAARISRASINLPEEVQALRLQFNPLSYGGRYLVMRLLFRGKNEDINADVSVLGYNKKQVALLRRMSTTPVGIGIVSGPTGSGKSTTLFHILTQVMRDSKYESNVLTIEDPPERPIAHAKQMPVTNAPTPEERSRKFIQSITSAMRSDPDTIMIGEIRDKESAKLAIEAAMTGHQVWTTVHANDALMIVNRLRDIGVPEYNLFTPGMVFGLIAQRLTRTLCPNCKVSLADAIKAGDIDDEILARIDQVADRGKSQIFIAGPGCDVCGIKKGYGGRTVVAEVINPDEQFMSLMQANDRLGAREYWLKTMKGQSMMGHAIEKMLEGTLSPTEIERVMGPIELQPGMSV